MPQRSIPLGPVKAERGFIQIVVEMFMADCARMSSHYPPWPVLLRGNQQQRFLQVEPPRQPFLQYAHIAFVHFDLDRRASRVQAVS